MISYMYDSRCNSATLKEGVSGNTQVTIDSVTRFPKTRTFPTWGDAVKYLIHLGFNFN